MQGDRGLGFGEVNEDSDKIIKILLVYKAAVSDDCDGAMVLSLINTYHISERGVFRKLSCSSLEELWVWCVVIVHGNAKQKL